MLVGRRLGLILSVCIAAAGCAGSEKARRSAKERVTPLDGARVAAVEIRGNHTIDDDTLRSGLATRPPSGLIDTRYTRFDPLLLQVDIERIEAYYRRQGFFTAEVTDVQTRETSDGEVAVTIDIDEGAPSTIAQVTIDGMPESLRGEPRVAESIRGLRVDAVYKQQEYLQAKRELQELLARHGHAHAQVGGTVAVDRDQSRVEVRLSVDPGPLVRLGEVIIRGLDRVPASAVLVRVAWERGDVFDPELLEITQGRLYRLEHFRTASVELVREGRPAVADVRIRVSEGARHQVRLGGGIAGDNTYWEMRARADYKVTGLLDSLTTLRLDARPAYTLLRNQEGTRGFGGTAHAELERNDLFAPRLRGSAQIRYSAAELDAYSVRGPSARIELSRPFAMDRLQAGLGWELSYLDFPAVHPAIHEQLRQTLKLDDSLWLGYFDQSITYDQRDNILDPRSGFYVRLRLEESGAYAASQAHYIRGTAEARGYLPIGERVVLATRVRIGSALLGELPATRRYLAGGASSHRGFGQRRLTPAARAPGAGTAPIGGNVLVGSSLESRVDVWRLGGNWLGVAAFVDMGDVTRSASELDLTYLHWAAGMGLRYDTLVGPIRLDVARRLTRTGAGQPDPGSIWAFHVSIGEAF